MKPVLERLIDKISTATTDPAPSDNIYIEDVFPPMIYSEIVTRLPSDGHYNFIDHPDAVLPNGNITRKLLDLTEETIKTFNPEDQEFWKHLKDIFISDMLLTAITQKFRGKLNMRFGPEWPEMILVPVFYRDYAGYRIGVHTDAPYKIATMQFYLPKDSSQIHLGTSFHKREGNNFNLLKTNAFKPNSAYAFARTDSSWHSVLQMAEHESKRDTLALTVYIKGYEYKSNKGYL